MIKPESIEEAIKHLQGARHALTAAEVDITPDQYAVLSIIAEDGKASPADMARRLKVAPTVVTGFCDRLVVAGRVERQFDPADRRRQWVAITPSGRDVLAQAETALEQAA